MGKKMFLRLSCARSAQLSRKWDWSQLSDVRAKALTLRSHLRICRSLICVCPVGRPTVCSPPEPQCDNALLWICAASFSPLRLSLRLRSAPSRFLPATTRTNPGSRLTLCSTRSLPLVAGRSPERIGPAAARKSSLSSRRTSSATPPLPPSTCRSAPISMSRTTTPSAGLPSASRSRFTSPQSSRPVQKSTCCSTCPLTAGAARLLL